MSRILFALLLCCLALAWAEGEGVNDKDIAAGEEDFAASNVIVKREAVAATNKKKAKKNRSKKTKKRNMKRKKSKNSKNRKRQGRKANKGGKKKAKKSKANSNKRRRRKGTGKSNKRTKSAGKSKKKRKKERKRKITKRRKSTRKGNKNDRARKTKQRRKTQMELKAEKISNSNAKKMARQATNYTSCVEKFIEYSRINELKARSIEMQVNRINGFKGIQDKKKGKKGNFQGTYNTLLSALGGNESAPECDGKPINGTSRNAKYKDTLKTLKDCETSVEKICNYELNSTYNSTLQGCLAAAKKFKSEFKNCFSAKKSSAEACTCADAIDTDNLKKLKACDTKAESDKIKASKKACIKGFIKCKTAQDDSVDGVGSCKKVNKCGGAPNKTEAARLLKILKPLSDALANTGFADALKKAGLNSGAGSDGKLPTRLTQLRMARMVDGGRQGNNTDGQGCKDIEAEWKNFNTSGDKAVPGVDGDVDEAETKNTIASLDKLNNRKTLDADLASCAKEDSRQVSVTITIVKIRFYVFWCGWFQVTVVEIKITIITITFGLPPSPSPPSPAPAPVATSAPGGGRHNIAKHIMNRAALVKK